MNIQLKKFFDGNLNEYKSIPFWSWNNFLDEEELTKQIEAMHEAGIGGFIMHARTGLGDKYLGEKWFSCIGACLKKAKELGMNAWVYDENGWPSGFVGGKLLETEAYRARFLRYSVGEYDESAFATFITDEELGFKRVESKVDGVEEYHRIYLMISPANSDILNPDAVEAFIQATHEEYYRRFKDSFGKELVGFFTDEPQYYRAETPYAPSAAEIFAKDGEDIRDGLVWLFVHDKRGYEYRQKYFSVMNKLYVEVFYKRLYGWCEEHGCKLTGHSVEESCLFTQMWGGGVVATSYEYEHIPGVDWLGRHYEGELACKQIASAAAQLGKKQILTETYGCCGHDVTPIELKNIAEAQYFQGVNLMCQHLYPYSVASNGKRDFPPVFSPHGNWGEGFKTFNDYFTKLGALVVNTEEIVDVAILHPIRDVWLEYVRSEDYHSVAEIEENFKALLAELRKHGVTYHFIDEELLSKYGKVEGNILRVGERAYDTLIIPKMLTIKESSYELLQRYEGKLCVFGAPAYLDGKKADITLKQNVTLEEIENSTKIKYACADGNTFITHRKSELGEFLFLKNISSSENSTATIKDGGKNYLALNLDGLEESAVGDSVLLTPGEGMVLIKTEEGEKKAKTEERKDVTDSFRVTRITENYCPLDYCQIAREGQEFGKRLPTTALFEELLREDYKGEISVRQTFTLQEKMPLTLIMEKAKLKWAKVNGKEVVFTQNNFDVNFVETQIGELVKEGENEFVYAFDFWQHDGVHFALFDPLATESLRNCLYYDTAIENSYLEGDFTVNADMVLCKRVDLPPVTKNLYQCGYPFFKGALTLEGKLVWDGEEEIALRLIGRFITSEIKINGKKVDVVLKTEKTVTPLLKKGENDVEITVRSSLRNFFGPHHFKCDPEPLSVSPTHFDMRTTWENGVSDLYVDEYFSVPFGLERIEQISKK